jgi:hypothetical protein
MTNSFLWIIFGLETIQRSAKVFVHRKGHLEDIESVGIDVLESVLLFVLNRILQGADVLVTVDLNCEDVAGIVAENQSIEVQYVRHAMSKQESNKGT